MSSNPNSPRKSTTTELSKFMLILGGFLGFALALLFGFIAGNEGSIILKNAALSAVVGAILLKVCLHVIESNIEKVCEERDRLKEQSMKREASDEILRLTQELNQSKGD